MPLQVNYMFKSTHAKILEKAHDIQRQLKVDIPAEIAEAYAHGEWHDNPGWDAALEKQAMMRLELERTLAQLKDPVFIEDCLPSGLKVSIGTEVVIRNLDTNDRETLIIVGPADVVYSPNESGDKCFVSLYSPIALALMYKLCGDILKTNVSGKEKRWVILSIEVIKSDKS